VDKLHVGVLDTKMTPDALNDEIFEKNKNPLSI